MEIAIVLFFTVIIAGIILMVIYNSNEGEVDGKAGKTMLPSWQKDLHTIKNIAMFFCVLTIISVVAYIAYLITLLK